MANTVGNKPVVTAKPVKFIKECMVELRKTSWPTKDELKKSTLVVLGALLVVMLWIGILDSLFGWGLRLGHLN